jgi:hypothetical protein
VAEKEKADAVDSMAARLSTSFYDSEAGFHPINVLVLADKMLRPDHEGDP